MATIKCRTNGCNEQIVITLPHDARFCKTCRADYGRRQRDANLIESSFHKGYKGRDFYGEKLREGFHLLHNSEDDNGF